MQAWWVGALQGADVGVLTSVMRFAGWDSDQDTPSLQFIMLCARNFLYLMSSHSSTISRQYDCFRIINGETEAQRRYAAGPSLTARPRRTVFLSPTHLSPDLLFLHFILKHLAYSLLIWDP